MIAGAIRYQLRKSGKPDPILLEADFRRLPDGSNVIVAGSERPLAPELGGDGRTLADIGKEVVCPDPNSPALQAMAAKIKERLLEAGIATVIRDGKITFEQGGRPAPAKFGHGGRRPGAGRPLKGQPTTKTNVEQGEADGGSRGGACTAGSPVQGPGAGEC
jgi:hypothetical protein